MNNIVRWDLFGECVYEELNFEKIPEYVKDDFNETIAAYSNWKADESFSISELVRDIFYVSILSEIAPPTNIDDISRMTKNYGSARMSGNYFCHCVESQIKQNLDVVDKINGQTVSMQIPIEYFQCFFNGRCESCTYKKDLMKKASSTKLIFKKNKNTSFDITVGNTVLIKSEEKEASKEKTNEKKTDY